MTDDVTHEFLAHMNCHRPTYDKTTEDIEYEAEIQKAELRPTVCDVGNPALIGSSCGEVPNDEIQNWTRVAIADCCRR